LDGRLIRALRSIKDFKGLKGLRYKELLFKKLDIWTFDFLKSLRRELQPTLGFN